MSSHCLLNHGLLLKSLLMNELQSIQLTRLSLQLFRKRTDGQGRSIAGSAGADNDRDCGEITIQWRRISERGVAKRLQVCRWAVFIQAAHFVNLHGAMNSHQVGCVHNRDVVIKWVVCYYNKLVPRMMWSFMMSCHKGCSLVLESLQLLQICLRTHICHVIYMVMSLDHHQPFIGWKFPTQWTTKKKLMHLYYFL